MFFARKLLKNTFTCYPFYFLLTVLPIDTAYADSIIIDDLSKQCLEHQEFQNDQTGQYAVVLNNGFYLEGKDLTIKGNGRNAGGIYTEGGQYVRLDNCGITLSGSDTDGIVLVNLKRQSSISNSQINSKGNNGHVIMAAGTGTDIVLDNVQIAYETIGEGSCGYGVHASNGARISNMGHGAVSISIEGETASIGIFAAQNASVSLRDSTLAVVNARYVEGAIYAENNSAVTLENTSIHVGSGTIIGTSQYESNTVRITGGTISTGSNMSNLVYNSGKYSSINVYLADVAFQSSGEYNLLVSDNNMGDTRITVTGGTGFAGKADNQAAAGRLYLELNHSKWEVADDSTLTGLDLSGASTLVFRETSPGDFTDIQAASIMLSSASVLALDTDDVDYLIDNRIEFQLFKGMEEYLLNNVAMVTADGRYSLDYEEGARGAGWFIVVSKSTHPVIPEPAIPLLAILGIPACLNRRNRSTTE